MNISASGASSFPPNVDTRTEMGVAVLKKAQEQMTQQASALIESIDQPPPAEHGNRLDTYA